jgi:hypothetical protein
MAIGWAAVSTQRGVSINGAPGMNVVSSVAGMRP